MSNTETGTGIHVQYVDPREVVIKANVRTDVNLTREFVASIKRHGVIVPESDTEAIRIIRQLIANDQRAELTEGERAAAWKQLELDGLSVTAIARELSEKPKRVKAGLAVVDSEVATNAVTEHQLTLDQALVLIESRATPTPSTPSSRSRPSHRISSPTPPSAPATRNASPRSGRRRPPS